MTSAKTSPFLADTINILDEMIAYPTISADSNLEMITALATRLDELGARVHVQNSPDHKKANLFASFGPEIDGGILLSGHSDVVPVAGQDWSADPFIMREADGKLFGRGTCDMKGFIAAAMALAPRFAACAQSRPIHFAFTYDEETGCIGAKALAEFMKTKNIRPDIAIIGEPTEMRLIEGHKGVCEYTARFSGLAGHGSAPDLGVNAVEYAVRYVTRLMEIREDLKARAPSDSPFEPPWTTINIGALKGGFAHNVIAESAEVEWEFRPVQNQDYDFVHREINTYVKEVLLPQMRAVEPAANIEVETVGEVVGLEPMPDCEAKKLVSELTGANHAETVAFGTEAGIFQSLGTHAVVCGPGSIAQAHKADEYIEIDQLNACLKMLDNLAAKLV